MIKDTRSGAGFFKGTINTTNKDKDEKNVRNSYIINNHFYQLDIGCYSVNSLGTLEIIDRYTPKNNSIYIDSPIKFIRVFK